MTEKYAPNLDQDRMRRILDEEDTGVLALVDGARPYAVPVSYALIDDFIVIHGALRGRKIEVLRRNPAACFVVSRNLEPTRPHRPETGCTYRFESVICGGEARVVEDVTERLGWLQRFKSVFDRKLGVDPASEPPLGEQAAGHCSCIIIRITAMTGRSKIERVQD